MATHDYILANASGAAFRTDLNNALAAIVSNNSNSSSPATTYAYQWWADTSAGVLKIRNSANNAWIELLQLDGTLTLEDGSASAPALAFRDDLDTGIFSGSANELNISAGGTEQFAVTTAGVTIGTGHTPTAPLSFSKAVYGDQGSEDFYRIKFNDVGGTGNDVGIGQPDSSSIGFNTVSSGTIRFYQGTDGEVMRITSSQTVSIGTTTNTEKLLVAGAIDFTGAATGNTANSGKLSYESGTAFLQSKGPDTSTRGKIAFNLATSNGGLGYTPMTLDTDGDVLIGLTSNTDNGSLAVNADASGGNVGISSVTANNDTRFHLLFRNGNGQVGSISTNGSATAFNTSSDYRLKENATAISDGITRLKTLKPYRFNFKSDASTTVDGFFAHEVTAVPEAITGTKDAVDSNNNPVYQGIDQSKLVPLLVAAIQELITKVETLEAA